MSPATCSFRLCKKKKNEKKIKLGAASIMMVFLLFVGFLRAGRSEILQFDAQGVDDEVDLLDEAVQLVSHALLLSLPHPVDLFIDAFRHHCLLLACLHLGRLCPSACE